MKFNFSVLLFFLNLFLITNVALGINYTFITDETVSNNIILVDLSNYNKIAVIKPNNSVTINHNYSKFALIKYTVGGLTDTLSGIVTLKPDFDYLDTVFSITNCSFRRSSSGYYDLSCTVAQQPAGLPVGQVCTTNSNCNTNQCEVGICKVSSPDQTCQSDTDCTTGSCVNNKCVISQIAGSCKYDSDCTSGNCKSNLCNYAQPNKGSCQSNNDCTTNICDNYKCLMSGLYGACQNDGDCTTGKCAANGMCLNKPQVPALTTGATAKITPQVAIPNSVVTVMAKNNITTKIQPKPKLKLKAKKNIKRSKFKNKFDDVRLKN